MTDEADEEGELTLAFELEAFEALAYPQEAFADARRWSQYVGVVANDASAVESAVRRHGVRQDYELGDLDSQSVLSRLKWEADTDRYVFIGTDDEDEALAEYVNWEYLSIKKAAEEAGWRLEEDLNTLERIWARLPWRLQR